MTHIDSSATAEDRAGMPTTSVPAAQPAAENASAMEPPPATEPARVREIGGRKDGPEPTRFGDWERNGRCVDF